MGETFGVYDEQKVIDCLMADGMGRDEAIEYYEYNIAGAYVGPSTPAFVQVGPLGEHP